ncbi:MAG: energy transducer TonB, partial [bacterium]
MLSVFLLSLLGSALEPPGYTAVTDNGATVILYADKTWMLYALPEGAEMMVSPIAVTEDSQLVFLKERKWKHISPGDTVDASYDSITKPIVPYYILSKEPHIRDIPNVVYPSDAARKRQEGTVVLKLLVDTDGDVIAAEVLESSGFMELDNAAIKNGWRTKFSPPKYNDMPVRVWVSLPIDFR